MNIEARICSILRDRILTNGNGVRIDADTPLLSAGLTLDSVAVLELVMEIEEAFGVEFKDTELSVDLFKTVGSLARGVSRKLAA